MTFITRSFGKIDIDESKIITFSEGLPGFLHFKKFILITEENDDIFCWLQSLDDGDIAFALLDVFKVLPNYSPEFEISDLSSIDVSESSELAIYNIVVIPEDISKMSVNLLAPLIINLTAMKGIQFILSNDKYGVRHYIFDEIKKINTVCVEGGE